jgi:hypothetical protein
MEPQAGSSSLMLRGSRSFASLAPLLRLAHKILAIVSEGGVAAGPVEPLPAERVLDQELHHVAWGEELVADRELAAVARSPRLLPHPPALLGRVEVLVDPADGLVLGPERRQVGGIEQCKQLQQCGLAREQPRVWGVSIEQQRQILRELVEQAEEIAAISVADLAERKRITTRLPVLDVLLEGDMFSQGEDFEILLEAHNRKNEVVGEAKAGGPVNPATGTVTLKPRERMQVTMKMQLEFEGKFTVKALNPTTLAAYCSLELETDYTV